MTFTTDNPLATSLAADPFTSLAVHYGMLLGVGDFEVLAANPRGKLRLHQAWQHGPGVVWGYEPSVEDDTTELRVSPGLAVDGVGREVASSSEQCLDVLQWFAEHEDDLATSVVGDVTTFEAEVWLRYRACLARPVPAMSSTCAGSQRDTEFSRILETAELELRGGVTPDDRGDAYPDLRALVRDGDAGETAASSWLQAFRAVAAAETVGLTPPAYAGTSPSASRLFPVSEPGEILLARLQLRIDRSGPTPVVTAPAIDISVRRSHLPTWVIEELLAEVLSGQAAAPTASGPLVEDIARAGTTVTVTFSTEIVESTVVEAFEVSELDLTAAAAGPAWTAVPLVHADLDYQSGPPVTISFDLPAVPTGDVSYRLSIYGTGPAPLVGLVDGVPLPLAGRRGGPATAAGQNVVQHFLP